MKAEGYLKTAFFYKKGEQVVVVEWISWGWVTLTPDRPSASLECVPGSGSDAPHGWTLQSCRQNRGRACLTVQQGNTRDRGARPKLPSGVRHAQGCVLLEVRWCRVHVIGRQIYGSGNEWPPVDTVKPLSQELSKPQGAAGQETE